MCLLYSNFKFNTGIDRSESMDSIISNDDERPNQDFDSDSSSKEIFKNIRTRYLSRVHSVSDPPLHSSIIDQAFFKSSNNNENGEVFKFEIQNVTTDESNVDDSLKLPPVEDKVKVKTEILELSPFDNKELMRQDAFDLEDKIIRQDAFDRHDSPELTYDIDDLKVPDYKAISKSESSFEVPIPRTIFSEELSGLYKGKPKAFSLDNLNSNSEFKDALKEATSIEFLNGANNYSEASLFTEGSDSVFLSPIEKNNNNIRALSENSAVTDNDLSNDTSKHVDSVDVPAVTTEKTKPRPSVTKPKSTNLSVDDVVKSDLEKVNEELKLTFKAAIDRIMSDSHTGKTNTNQPIDVSETDTFPSTIEPSDMNSTSPVEANNNTSQDNRQHLDDTEIVNPDKKVDTVPKAAIVIPNILSVPSTNNNNTLNVYPNKDSINKVEQITPTIIINNSDEVIPDTMDTSDTKKSFREQLKEESKEEKEFNNDQNVEKVVDDVSYHLKINNKDLDTGVNEIVQIENPHVPIPKKRLKTYVAPLKIVATNFNVTAPVIISPVLIQPLTYIRPVEQKSNNDIIVRPPRRKALESRSDVEIKKSVYYDDTDLVAGSSNADKNEKKQGIYQKNPKAKPLLPLIPNENNSHKDTAKVTAKNQETKPKLSQSAEWLLDNNYYQPMENVPFIINTVQTFTKANDTIKQKIAKEFPVKTIEDENVYEEIREPVLGKNVADDDKISNKIKRTTEELPLIPREELLNVPRKPKKPKNEKIQPDDESSNAKSVINLSRSPSANSQRKSSATIGDIIQNLEKLQDLEVSKKNQHLEKPQDFEVFRKFSLQTQKPHLEVNTGSLPRERPYWKTLEHKRLSHPIRSLNPSIQRKSKLKSTCGVNNCSVFICVIVLMVGGGEGICSMFKERADCDVLL